MTNVANKQMRAVKIHRFGGPQELEMQSVSIPTPGANEVLVKVHAAGVNPLDWKVREGYLAQIIPHQLPLTLGWDFSGEIAALGANVDSWNIGDQVYARPDFSKDGAYAEYIVVAANEIAAKPKTLSWQKAAAVPLVTLTAWQALNDIAQIKQGDKVLIHAGAGGVGIAAIQLAKRAGAKVYTTASTRNVDFLKDLGADEVIDYTKQDFSTLKDMNIVIDTLGGEALEKSWDTLTKGGIVVSVAEFPSEEIAKEKGVRAQFCFVQPNPSQLDKIAELIDSGNLKIEVDSVFCLEDAAKAQSQSQSGHTRGKIVLQIQQE